MIYIYILLLQSNKYYVGKTTNPEFRIESHFNSNGSVWTQKYNPIEVIEIIENCDSFDEDKYVLKYMNSKGIDNVRGGSFSQIELSDEQIELINKMLRGANDECFNCGESGHFSKECIESKIQEYLKDLNNENIQNETIKINSIYEEIIELNRLIKLTDFICIDDLPKIKKESQDMKKLNKLQEEVREIQEEDPYNRNNLYREKLRLISGQIQELNYLNQGNCWKNEIYQIYRQINNDHFINLNKDIIILGLELIKFNLEKKKRLKEIFEEYQSEDFVKELLSRLHQREIKLLQDLIVKKI